VTDNSSFDRPLIIATRASRLAVWQAEHVRSLLMAAVEGLEVELLRLSTRGDEILDRSLQKVGGKGLFIKELEMALADGRADLAVHSLKDVPVVMPEGFVLASILPRAEVRDAWVSNKYASLDELPHGAIVGTSSLRREAQLRRLRPDIVVKPLRGNLDTRLSKLDDGQFDAIVLAAAGLQRLGLESRIRKVLPVETILPAVGQGALGIEVCQHRTDVIELVKRLSCQKTTACAIAERAVSRRLGGSCSVPLAAHATIDPKDSTRLSLRALVATPDGRQMLQASATGTVEQADAMGQQVAEELLANGATPLLEQFLQAD